MVATIADASESTFLPARTCSLDGPAPAAHAPHFDKLEEFFFPSAADFLLGFHIGTQCARRADQALVYCSPINSCRAGVNFDSSLHCASNALSPPRLHDPGPQTRTPPRAPDRHCPPAAPLACLFELSTFCNHFHCAAYVRVLFARPWFSCSSALFRCNVCVLEFACCFPTVCCVAWGADCRKSSFDPHWPPQTDLPRLTTTHLPQRSALPDVFFPDTGVFVKAQLVAPPPGIPKCCVPFVARCNSDCLLMYWSSMSLGVRRLSVDLCYGWTRGTSISATFGIV